MLGTDPPLSHMDLISCRNVLIYFGPVMQQRVIDTLAYALRPTGCIILGSSDNTGRLPELFVPLDEQHRIYCRRATVGPRDIEFFDSVDALPEQRPDLGFLPAPRARAPLQEEAVHSFVDQMLLSRYGPSGVIVDKDLRIVEFRGEVSPYIQEQNGAAGEDLLTVVRDDVAVPLRNAIQEAHRQKTTVRLDRIQVRQNRAFRFIRVTVIPVSAPLMDPHSVILFEDFADSAERALKHASQMIPATPPEGPGLEGPDRHIQQLEQELASSREYLQSIIEELRATNEEVQSANEELQSSNEELQTTKEELQASNEELTTVNAEMQSRNVQLGQAYDDLGNLLSSISTPIVMVGKDLRIRRFTPAAQKLLHLIPGRRGAPHLRH